MNKSLLIVISSPSGGGKSVIVSKLIKRLPGSTRMIATTTRDPRKKEKDKIDYFFISTDKFKKMIAENKFIEHNFYANDYYGTEKNKLDKIKDKFKAIFLTLDVNGKKSLDKLKIPHLSIFLVPEDMDKLSERIKKRGGTTEKSLRDRLEIAKKELKQAKIYDERVINYEGQIEKTVEKTLKIIKKTLEALDKKPHLG